MNKGKKGKHRLAVCVRCGETIADNGGAWRSGGLWFNGLGPLCGECFSEVGVGAGVEPPTFREGR